MALELRLQAVVSNSLRTPVAPIEPAAVSTDWKRQLPVLTGTGITLRELRMSDAPALLALLTTEEEIHQLDGWGARSRPLRLLCRGT